MTEVTAANVKKHNSGDQVKVTADISNVQNGYTYTVPGIRNIEDFCVTCTTDDDIGGTKSGNTITFACGATLVGVIAIYGR